MNPVLHVQIVPPEPLRGSSTVERATVNRKDDGFESLLLSQIFRRPHVFRFNYLRHDRPRISFVV